MTLFSKVNLIGDICLNRQQRGYFIDIDNAWPLKAAGKSCTNYAKMQTQVETQIQCQALCELENGCVGITYSHTHEEGQHCYICYNTIAQKDASNGFHFYQMPGVIGKTML